MYGKVNGRKYVIYVDLCGYITDAHNIHTIAKYNILFI